MDDAEAVFGAGGLGMSAVQLARALHASTVIAVDIDPERLLTAETLGAVPVDASGGDPSQRILEITSGKGVDVSLELVGIPETIGKAVESVGPGGRVGLVGIGDDRVSLDIYRTVVGKEATLIGVSDHLNEEIPPLLELAAEGKVSFGSIVTETVALDAGKVNRVLDRLDAYGPGLRSVIVPDA